MENTATFLIALGNQPREYERLARWLVAEPTGFFIGERMNDLALLGEKEERWYTIEEIAELCGYEPNSLKYGEANLSAIMEKMSINIEVNTKIGGYHNTKKYYSEKVLEAVKKYQILKSSPNALKDKETAIQGNVNYIGQATVKQTIDNLLDNPDTLQLLLTKSLERNQALGIENKQLKEIIEEQKPKVEVYNGISDSSTLQDLQTAAQTVGLKNVFKVLVADGIIEPKMLSDGQSYYKPYARYSEYLVLKDGKGWKDDKGVTHIRPRVFVTGKGIVWLTRKYGA